MNSFLTNYNGAEVADDHFLTPAVMRYTHTHPVYELYLCPHVVSQTSVINGASYSYSYPVAILSAPYTVHSMSCDDVGAKKYERYVFYFDKNFFDNFRKDIFSELLKDHDTGLMFRLTEEQGLYLKNMIDFCYMNESMTQKKLSLAMILNKLTEFCPAQSIVRVGTEYSYIKDVLRFLSEENERYWDSEDIARRFAVSRSKLERDFKRSTGMTVHSFSDMCRINRAKKLLTYETDMSISVIAVRCGFDSENYFFPFFKKHTGCTPLEYRRKFMLLNDKKIKK